MNETLVRIHVSKGEMVKTIIMIICASFLIGCGYIKRSFSGWTGSPSEYCYREVLYLQFPSGAVVALDQRGNPIPCR